MKRAPSAFDLALLTHSGVIRSRYAHRFGSMGQKSNVVVRVTERWVWVVLIARMRAVLVNEAPVYHAALPSCHRLRGQFSIDSSAPADQW